MAFSVLEGRVHVDDDAGGPALGLTTHIVFDIIQGFAFYQDDQAVFAAYPLDDVGKGANDFDGTVFPARPALQ